MDIQDLFGRGSGCSISKESLDLFKQDEELATSQLIFVFANIEEFIGICYLFVDSTGLIGIAPDGTCVGDLICRVDCLESSPLECILRKYDGSGWTLVSGDYYRHRKGYKEDNSIGLTDFAIW